MRSREAILEAATAEFLRAGYAGANVRTIIQESGGSADGVYRLFENKAGLFKAVISRLMKRHFQAYIGPESVNQSVEEALYAFGLSYVTTVLGDEALGFYKMMIAESATLPEMSEVFWEEGPGAIAKQLETYLRAKTVAGHLQIRDPARAATQFLELMKGGLHIRLLCTGAKPTPAELENAVRSGVAVFLHGATG